MTLQVRKYAQAPWLLTLLATVKTWLNPETATLIIFEGLTAQSIHDLGLEEVAKLRQGVLDVGEELGLDLDFRLQDNLQIQNDIEY